MSGVDFSVLLPDVDAATFAKDEVRKGRAPRPRARAPKAPTRKAWSLTALAKLIGVSFEGLRVKLVVDVELQRLCDAPGGHRTHLGSGPGSGEHMDDVAARAAADYFVQTYLSWWSPKHKLTACTACGTKERPHHLKGLCRVCFARARPDERLAHRVAHHGAWDRERGHLACLVCGQSERPHHSQGRCLKCDVWWRRHQPRLTPKAFDAALKKRRKLADAGKLRRGVFTAGKVPCKKRKPSGGTTLRKAPTI